jgi:hypothetical protein
MIKLSRSDDDKHRGQELVAVTHICYAWQVAPSLCHLVSDLMPSTALVLVG